MAFLGIVESKTNIMKNIFTLLTVSIFICSCSTNESKIEDLISDYMFKNLNDFDSYESIELKVDSCYTSIYTDSFIVKRANNVYTFAKQSKELRKEERIHHNYIINNAKYITLDGVFEKYMASSEASQKLWSMINENIKIIENENEIIKVKANEFVPKLNGWQATHRFRCKNAGGTYTINNYMFYFDSDITKITSFTNLDDNKNYEIIKIIDAAIEGNGRKIIDAALEDARE